MVLTSPIITRMIYFTLTIWPSNCYTCCYTFPTNMSRFQSPKRHALQEVYLRGKQLSIYYDHIVRVTKIFERLSQYGGWPICRFPDYALLRAYQWYRQSHESNYKSLAQRKPLRLSRRVGQPPLRKLDRKRPSGLLHDPPRNKRKLSLYPGEISISEQ